MSTYNKLRYGVVNFSESRACFEDALDFKLLDQRCLMLNGPIDDYVSGKLIRSLQLLSSEPEEITLLISSEGGDVYPGMAIIQAMRKAQRAGCVIVGVVRGYAMSMACIILMACDLRYCSEDDVLMIHGATSMLVGDVRNQKADTKLTERTMDIHARFIAERNTSDNVKYADIAYWRRMLDDNFPLYFIGQEALEAGLVDEIIDSTR